MEFISMNKMALSLVAVAACYAMAGPARAAEQVVADLRTAVPAPAKVIAGGVVFTCEGARCVASVQSKQALTEQMCRQLAKRVGFVTQIGTHAKKLDAKRLESCNSGG